MLIRNLITLRCARLLATLFLALFICTAVSYSQQQARGRVINRDGTPQAYVRVDFHLNANQPASYSATTDPQGWFAVSLPAGNYLLRVFQGQQRIYEINVSVDGTGVHPSTFVVN